MGKAWWTRDSELRQPVGDARTYRSHMLQKRAYHTVVAKRLIAAGCVDEAERHIDAVGILTSALDWS